MRLDNEDCIEVDRALRVAVLADGMGGQNAGEVASRTAVDAVMRFLRSAKRPAIEVLEDAVRAANRAVYESAQERREYVGMGTTLIAVAVEDDVALTAHVGDSRAYLFAVGRLTRVTTDHSLVQHLVDSGVLTAEQARQSPSRHVVMRSLGMFGAVPCDLERVAFGAGDVLLLCSDGLTDMLDDEAIGLRCSRFTDLDELVDALVASALEAGGLDNVSVIAVGCGVAVE